MRYNIVLQRAVTFGLWTQSASVKSAEKDVATHVGVIPDEHAHDPAHAVRERGECSVICPKRILHTDHDTVAALATFALVVVLEVVRRLGETVEIGDIVDRVHNIKRVHNSGVYVLSSGWFLSGVGGVDERVSGSLSRNSGCIRFVRDGIVTTVGQSTLQATRDDKRNVRRVRVGHPAERGCRCVLRILQILETLSEDFFLNGENAVLCEGLELECGGVIANIWTDSELRDEVHHRKQLVGMRVNKGVNRDPFRIVLNSHYMREGNGSVGQSKVLQ